MASSNLDVGSFEGLRFRLLASGLTTEMNGLDEGASRKRDTLDHYKKTVES